MSKDDFDVIVCKVLSYLYACLKSGINANADKAHEVAGCNDLYWEAVLDDLADAGLIKVNFISANGVKYLRVMSIRITMDGARYLEDNDTMAKVKEVLGSMLPPIIDTAVMATSLL